MQEIEPDSSFWLAKGSICPHVVTNIMRPWSQAWAYDGSVPAKQKGTDRMRDPWECNKLVM